ncbi:hypothetical protein [Shewanella mangrovisoli]|uniref:hypothetical protein n=1 Tax=Shewanella mangrovisoli TaxID=2864211 RepID=UPI001C65DDB8|nr:hypothetical protein [Shewanella mangrovisoli]QYK10448.1 hypothetical protein K0H60_07145 [Shewanella mangrovisoli]
MNVLKKIYVMVSLKLCNFVYRTYSCLGDKKPLLLLYTDSRGTEIDSPLKQRNPFYSYLKYFRDYKVDYKFCPYKFTSILDFLEFYDNSNKQYKAIVLHCGIVDFAPRPMSSYNQMLSLKFDYLERRGWLEYFENRTDFLDEYLGEKTLQFMSVEFVENELIPLLKEVDNLIYVGINPVLNCWDGNYWRKRPSCINQQLVQDSLMLQELGGVILSSWDDLKVKKFTVDNVHYNKLGLDQIGKDIMSRL